LDGNANPDQLPVGSLALGYVEGVREVALPSDWAALRDGLREQIAAADSLVRERLPPATPSVECWHCPVRHMCDEYWDSSFTSREDGSVFTDAEVRILSRNGPTSWIGTLTRDDSHVLLRTRVDGASLPTDCDVRVLDLVAAEAEDLDGLILTLTHNSEVFGPVRR
jgi:hypothetical protein